MLGLSSRSVYAEDLDFEEDVDATTEVEEDVNAEFVMLSLEESIKLALTNNSKIQAGAYGIDAAEWKRSEANARFWPVMEYEYAIAPVPRNVDNAFDEFFSGNLSVFNRLKIGVGVPIYSFGKLSLVQRLADKGIEKAKQELVKERCEITFQVKKLYYGALLANEILRIMDKAYERLDKEIFEREEAHDTSPIDILKMKLFRSELEDRREETRHKEELAKEALRTQVGLAPNVNFVLKDKKLREVNDSLKDLTYYIEKAFNNRPDVKLLEAGVGAKKDLYDLETKKYLPDLGLGGYFEVGRTTSDIEGLVATDDFNDPFHFTRAGVGFRLSGKFDFHGSQARIKSSRSDYFKANLEGMMAREGIRLDVKKTYLDTKEAVNYLERMIKAQKLSRQLLFFTQSNYEIGIGEQAEYVDAVKSVLINRGKYLEAIYRYNVSFAELDNKIGKRPLQQGDR